MKGCEAHLRSRLALAALTLMVPAIAARSASAQYTGPASAYNPYTGRGVADGVGFNPLTRTAAPPAGGYNPLTGANPAVASPANPYTGTPLAAYNPYTGRYSPRAERRSPPGSYARRVPVTGKIGPGLEQLDDVMSAIMEKHGIPGGALAVVKDGKLVVARGYGWGNLDNAAPVAPDAVFAIASLSKCLTAAGVLKLVDDGKLKLEDRAFRLLSHLKPPPGAFVDPRLDRITVRQLLNHSGGWNRNISGDPCSFSWRVARRLYVPLPISSEQLIRFMLGERLDFDPGSEAQYSNFGYIVLGQVIEKVSGVSYGDFVASQVLKPMGLLHARLPGSDRGYRNDEVRLYTPGSYQLMPSDFLGPLGDASGGWRASAVDLARFLSALDGSRGQPFLSAAIRKEMFASPAPPIKANRDGSHIGLGWDAVGQKDGRIAYFKDGLLPGCRTFMGRTLAGVNYVLLFNSGERLTLADVTSELHLRHGVERSLKATIKWPDVDYFGSFQ